jgi:hypothetical protein
VPGKAVVAQDERELVQRVEGGNNLSSTRLQELVYRVAPDEWFNPTPAWRA